VIYPQEALVLAMLSNLSGILRDNQDQTDRITRPFLDAGVR